VSTSRRASQRPCPSEYPCVLPRTRRSAGRLPCRASGLFTGEPSAGSRPASCGTDPIGSCPSTPQRHRCAPAVAGAPDLVRRVLLRRRSARPHGDPPRAPHDPATSASHRPGLFQTPSQLPRGIRRLVSARLDAGREDESPVAWASTTDRAITSRCATVGARESPARSPSVSRETQPVLPSSHPLDTSGTHTNTCSQALVRSTRDAGADPGGSGRGRSSLHGRGIKRWGVVHPRAPLSGSVRRAWNDRASNDTRVTWAVAPESASGRTRARLPRKRPTQPPLPFRCTPFKAKTGARHSRSAANGNREEASRHVCHWRRVTSLPTPPQEGRSPSPTHSSRINPSPGCPDSFPWANHVTRHERLCRSGRRYRSRLLPCAPLAAPSTHRHTPSNARPTPVTPRLASDDRRDAA